MTRDEQLRMLTVMTGETDSDVLSTYLDLATGKVLATLFPYDGDHEVPEQYHTTTVEIAAYMVNKIGAEGEIQHTENGVNRIYEDGDIPTSLMRKLVPYAGVI